MRLRVLLLLAGVLGLLPGIHAAPEPPDVLSPAALVMDAGTGTVLWSRDPETPRPIASTTKIMTVLLIAESGRLDEMVTVSENAATVEEASLHLKAGEHITLYNLLYAIVLRSANDACVAAAEHLSGSVPAFVEKMNVRAKELGCTKTRFQNPHGLHHKEHVSTPRDLAIMARAVLAHPELRDVVAAKSYTIERDRNKYDRLMISRFKWFLSHYPGATGVKTGRTREAGRCFVGSAQRGQFELISVVLHSPSVPAETRTLLDWGFRNYRGGLVTKAGKPLGSIRVDGGARASAPVAAETAVPVVLPKSAPPVSVDVSAVRVRAPIRVGQKVGTASVLSGDKVVGTVPLIAQESVGVSGWRVLGRIVSGSSVLLLVGFFVGSNSKNTRRRRRRISKKRGGVDPRRSRSREWSDRPPR